MRWSYRPAIVPMFDRDDISTSKEFCLYVYPTSSENWKADRWEVNDEAPLALQDPRAGIPVRRDTSILGPEGPFDINDNTSREEIYRALGEIRTLLLKYPFRSVSFFADAAEVSESEEDFPLFSAPEVSKAVKMFISAELYDMGIYVNCGYGEE